MAMIGRGCQVQPYLGKRSVRRQAENLRRLVTSAKVEFQHHEQWAPAEASLVQLHPPQWEHFLSFHQEMILVV